MVFVTRQLRKDALGLFEKKIVCGYPWTLLRFLMISQRIPILRQAKLRERGLQNGARESP